MGSLPNVNYFLEGTIDGNADLAVLITEYLHSERKKYRVRNIEWVCASTRTKITPAQDMRRILLRRTTSPYFHKDISCIF